MKKLLVLVFAVLVAGCNNSSKYQMNFDVPDLAGSKMLLTNSIGDEITVLDSVELDSLGMGSMKGTIENPDWMRLSLAGTRRSIVLFMDNYDYTVKGNMQDLSIESDGGPQVDYNAYKDNMRQFSDRQQEIANRYYAARDAGVSNDSLEMILEPYYKIEDEVAASDSAYVVENPSSPVSVMLLRNMYYMLDAKELESKLSSLDPELHSLNYFQYMDDHLSRMKKVDIGMKYTDFALPDPDSNMVKLSDFAEKGVLLIDFWASWCQPCRRANPGVVEIYNKYHDKGFDIVGVSLDRSKEDWLEAIKADGLVWHHMSDLAYWDSKGADLYAVSAIPHTVLLDKDGIIVAKNLSEEELEAKIKELLDI